MIRSVVEDRDGASRRRASAVVGMIGGGQLARMTHQAAIGLGIHLEVLAASATDPAVLAGAPARVGDPDDRAALLDLAGDVDVVTFDHELVAGEALAAVVAAGHLVHPPPDALAMAQDKAFARRRLAELGMPGPAWTTAVDLPAVTAFAGEHGWPVVLKSATGGYDGRGVVVVDSPEAAAPVLDGRAWVVEELVDLATEVAVLVARRPGGEWVVWPVVETVQVDGMCREVSMPAAVPDAVAAEATRLAVDLVAAIGAVGVVAVEMFVDRGGRVLVNELALRPHNSGHLTIEATATSQFENHLRAVLDWPLGVTGMVAAHAVMVNVVGSGPSGEPGGLPAALAIEGAHVHLYAKTSRPDRKVGHVTVLGEDRDSVRAAAWKAANLLMEGADDDG